MLTTLASSATLDGYNDGLSAAEEVPGSVEARLSPALAQQAEFMPMELEHIDGGCGWVGGWAAGLQPGGVFGMGRGKASRRCDSSS